MNTRALGGVLVAIGLVLPVACSTTNNDDGGGSSSGGSSSGDPTVDGGGGGNDAVAPPPAACTKPDDCPSKVCTAQKVCAAPTDSDGVKNGTETDVDCGGGAKTCADDRKCLVASDCSSGVCKDTGGGLTCKAPAPDDGVKNGDETDVDCGGLKAPKCADTKKCLKRDDCVSDVCDNGTCKAPGIDGVKNGTETDVDCGGPGAARCADGLMCLVDGDCASDVCQDKGAGLKCQAPGPTDGKKNGTETDVDCGGADAGTPRCAAGKACLVHADCASDGCAYNNKCASKRSCTVQNGGDTCGLGGDGGRGAAQHEDCCKTAPAGNGGVDMNVYKVTAGRMRAFLTRVNGNVRGFVQQARADGKIPNSTGSVSVTSPNAIAGVSLLSADWDLYLPTSMEGNTNAGELTDTFYQDATPVPGIWTSAYRHVGGSIFNGQSLGLQGCSVSSYGTHAYWVPANIQSSYFGDVPHAHSQAVYDKKAMNCVDYLVAQAFCIWDGGRLTTFDEYVAAIGPNTMPWGATPTLKGQGDQTYFAFRFPTADDAFLRNPANGAPANLIPNANQSIERGVFQYSYEYPNLVCGPGANPAWCDYISFIAAPGRTTGRGPWGHADLAGNQMEVTSDITTNSTNPKTARMAWSTNGSFEGHGYSKSPVWKAFSLVNKYGKQGLRCVYP